MLLFGQWLINFRKAIGNRDDHYTLEGMIEMDEGCFTVDTTERKRGRGVVGKQNVASLTESTSLEYIGVGKKVHHCRYFKAKVLIDHKSEQINKTLKGSLVINLLCFQTRVLSMW